jgi:hypothetical protein
MHRPTYREEISGFGFELTTIDSVSPDTAASHRSKAPFYGAVKGDVTSHQYRVNADGLVRNDCFFVGTQVSGDEARLFYHAQITAISRSPTVLLEPCIGYFSGSGNEARGLYRPDYSVQEQAEGRVASFKGTVRPEVPFGGNLVFGCYVEATAAVNMNIRCYVTVNRYSRPDDVEFAQ